MLKLYDYHIHSLHSFDSLTSVADICREAKKKGLAGLTFTEHIELANKPDEADVIPKFPFYQRDIEKARTRYPDLELGMGLEIGFHFQKPDRLKELARLENWDFIIGSLHSLDGLLTYNGEFIQGKEWEQVFDLYFRGICQALEFYNDCDVVGHIDMLRRYYPPEQATWLTYDKFAEPLDRMFRLLIEKGIGLEVNTAAWRFKLPDPHPPLSLLQRYRRLGGEIITCGSDAHTLPSVGYRLADAYDFLRTAGFKYVSTFKERKLKQIPL